MPRMLEDDVRRDADALRRALDRVLPPEPRRIVDARRRAWRQVQSRLRLEKVWKEWDAAT